MYEGLPGRFALSQAFGFADVLQGLDVVPFIFLDDGAGTCWQQEGPFDAVPSHEVLAGGWDSDGAVAMVDHEEELALLAATTHGLDG